MIGGDIDKKALLESFAKIKEDINKLNIEIIELRNGYNNLLKENLILREQLNEKVKEAVKEALVKSNKQKKNLVKQRILFLAQQKNLTLSEMKEIIVDNEQICSKATFYRYIEKMQKLGLLSQIKINDIEIIAKI